MVLRTLSGSHTDFKGQGDFAGFMYGLKPVPTSPYLPSRTFSIEFFRSL